MKFSICNELFENWDLEKVFEFVSGIGYDGVETAPSSSQVFFTCEVPCGGI